MTVRPVLRDPLGRTGSRAIEGRSPQEGGVVNGSLPGPSASGALRTAMSPQLQTFKSG